MELTNRVDTVVFFGRTAQDPGVSIFTQNKVHVTEGVTIDGQTICGVNGPPAFLNNSDIFTFVACFNDGLGGPNNAGIFTQNQLLVQQGDTIAGKIITSLGGTGASINDSGAFVFRANFSDGFGVFTRDDLLVRDGDSIGGVTITSIDTPLINNRGDVAFFGDHSGGQGVFTLSDLVVQSGDNIDGKILVNRLNRSIQHWHTLGTLKRLARKRASRHVPGVGCPNLLGSGLVGCNSKTGLSLNNRGDLAFVGIFSDGTEGVVLAQKRLTDVTINITPGEDTNTINPRSKGVIPVAILTTDTFDATTVDPLSVEFGPGKTKEAHNKGHIEDVDGDGDDGLVLHFRTQETGIQCGDTEVSLTGETVDGTSIEGTDAIVTVGC